MSYFQCFTQIDKSSLADYNLQLDSHTAAVSCTCQTSELYFSADYCSVEELKTNTNINTVPKVTNRVTLLGMGDIVIYEAKSTKIIT